jgi:hypothetical protein
MAEGAVLEKILPAALRGLRRHGVLLGSRRWNAVRFFLGPEGKNCQKRNQADCSGVRLSFGR